MEQSFELFRSFAVQMFILVDPIVAVPIFLAITPRNSVAERRVMAGRGCSVAFLVIAFFLLLGPLLLDYFGVKTPAVQICGGILLFVIALEMLYGRPTQTVTTPEEEQLAGLKEDISITPLAIPMLSGPGAITTCLIFAKKADGVGDYLALLLAAGLIFGGTYLLMLRAEAVQRWLGGLGLTIVTRVMGLVLAFIAIQYAIDGVHTVIGS